MYSCPAEIHGQITDFLIHSQNAWVEGSETTRRLPTVLLDDTVGQFFPIRDFPAKNPIFRTRSENDTPDDRGLRHDAGVGLGDLIFVTSRGVVISQVMHYAKHFRSICKKPKIIDHGNNKCLINNTLYSNVPTSFQNNNSLIFIQII